ncbi:MAG: trigger factor [Pseudomonadota bacterium]|nr:trigger factor [Pseudomonadota bacterium]
MEVSIETTGGLQRRLKIAVAAESFEERINERLKETSQRVKLDGFRPGKVPFKEVRRRFGGSVRQEVAQEMIQSSYMDALQQEELDPAGSPALDVINMDVGADLEFTATFEVFPKFDISDLSQVSIKRPEGVVKTEDLDGRVERLRQERKHFHEVERPADVGDRLTVDFEGTIAGELFEGGEAEGVAFIVGEGQMIEGIDAGVRGMNDGESKQIPVTFPDEYQDEKLQGKEAVFDLTVTKIEAPHLPDLDEKFFSSFGIEEGGEEAFRDQVRENMERDLKVAVGGQVKRQVLDGLSEIHEFQLPQSLVDRESETLRTQMLQQLRIDPSSEKPELPADLFSGEAEKRVRIGLVVNRIVETCDLKVDEDRVRERVDELSKPYDQPEQIVNWYYSNETQLRQIQLSVLEDQVVDHVLEAAKVEVVESDYDDILSGRATAPEPIESNRVDGTEGRTEDSTEEM